MKRDIWSVGSHGIRPAGKPDRCFYCGEALGEEHKDTCVIRSRTVVIRATIEYAISVPENWDTQLIEFQRNDGSWCADNFISELEELRDRKTEDLGGGMKIGCVCEMTSFEYVREATPEDEELNQLFVSKLPS